VPSGRWAANSPHGELKMSIGFLLIAGRRRHQPAPRHSVIRMKSAGFCRLIERIGPTTSGFRIVALVDESANWRGYFARFNRPRRSMIRCPAYVVCFRFDKAIRFRRDRVRLSTLLVMSSNARSNVRTALRSDSRADELVRNRRLISRHFRKPL